MNMCSYSKLGIDENGQNCTKSKYWLFTLRSQTLTDFIFKCDEFQKNECGFILGRSDLVKKNKMVNIKMLTFDLKMSKFDFDLNGQMTILPLD